MGNNASGEPNGPRMSVKGPLIFSAVLGVIAGFCTMIFSTGGAENQLRWDLGVTAAGVAFIASLLVVAVLTMAGKDNPDHLSQGSGVNRSSAKIPGGAGSVGGPKRAPREPQADPDTPRDEDQNDDGGSHRPQV
ncbi:hypothetical protein [Arthrobacter crystallopoietes]|uniref:Uncharacterized protein n=1 Tax=Crystallibacter crystallopoietes TaxID=37928 RepID=A0A1H1DBT7_9MICC|nr:hypothetical protein [Arthrobacter crystallopoietes]AUI50372.1 hypothetical protein AC20117_05580 [Arthrobacter crystallopoietes]SDQ74015.1 hypothetical protein SAMN04489742_2369 [Arthrobacter crystallopoietes]